MQVTIERATIKPIDVISQSAGVCVGKTDSAFKRVKYCYEHGHMSVFEHASVSLRIEGISRACLAQLTRHRHASFSVESQRYIKYDLSGDDWYVIPPSFDNDVAYFRKCMREAAGHYMICTRGGTKPEDARYLLPEATKTNLVMTCNVRELFHILDMRSDSAAQWEIRQLVSRIIGVMKECSEQWWDLMLLREGR